MIRLILVVLFLVIFFIISLPIFLVEWLIGKWNPHLRDISSLRIVQFAFKCILFLAGTRVTFIGQNNIPKDQSVLYVGNHCGFFDVVATYSVCPNLTGYIAKIEISKVPILNHWMKLLHCLFLDRSDIKAGMKMILTGIEYIKQGISIFIFPEGTRSKTGKMLPFKEGSMKLASKTGCPIIPVAITNSSAVLEDHFPFIKSAKMIVEYGTPIDPKSLTKEEQKFLGAYVQTRVQEMLDGHSINK